MSLCVVSRLQAQTLYIYLEIQTLSNTVVHLLINRDGFTSIWGVSHSVCQSSHIISHHLTSELKMKRDFNSNNLERPQNISSNFVTEGFQLVTSARWILSRVDSRSAEPRRLLHFCCSSQTSLFLPLISGSQACFFFFLCRLCNCSDASERVSCSAQTVSVWGNLSVIAAITSPRLSWGWRSDRDKC